MCPRKAEPKRNPPMERPKARRRSEVEDSFALPLQQREFEPLSLSLSSR